MPRRGPTDVDKAVGARVRDRRVILGHTQSDVAGMVGITPQQMHMYESGGHRISCGRISEIAAVLGRPVGYFFGEYEEVTKTLPEESRKVLGMTRAWLRLPAAMQTAVRDHIVELSRAHTAFCRTVDRRKGDVEK